jgi:hypothetical protein
LPAIGAAVVDFAVAVMIAGLRMLAWSAQRPSLVEMRSALPDFVFSVGSLNAAAHLLRLKNAPISRGGEAFAVGIGLSALAAR